LSFKKKDDAGGVDMWATQGGHAQHTDNNADAKHTKLQSINGYTKQKQNAPGVSKKAIGLEHVHM
tara:strand:+ start:1003 stop:1197 length:195 start_codon:yes stop_codon:yes gene_type:complete